MSRKDEYTTGNLLDYLYHQNYNKLICIDLSIQGNTSIRQKINFIRKLEEDDGPSMFFIAKEQQKTYFKFFCRLMKPNSIM